MDIAKNPFLFGQLVKSENFYNRREELVEIKRAILNNYSFWINSPRGFGISSLILKAFEELTGVKTIYLDLYNIETLHDFAEKYSRVVLKALPISFEPQVIEDKIDIDNILNIPEQIAAKQNLQVCIAFDEFQEVHRIEPFLVNWMRSAFQAHKKVSYVFLGSKQSLMETIFADANSPFYEFGFKIPIKEISRKDWQTFIRDKFLETSLTIHDETIEAILDKSGGYPHFTQYFASMVWEFLRQGYDQKDPGFTDTWMNRIIAAQSIIFQNQFDQLNRNQRKTLTAIASLHPGEQLFSASCRKRFKLPASSTLTVTVNALLKKDLITKTNGDYMVLNPVLREWLVRL